MFSTDDTIVAVATPAGHGGVGLVRLSGTAAAAIGQGLTGHPRAWPARYAVRAAVATGDLDADALVTYFPGPASYTGEDVLEVSAHGSPVILAAIVRRAVELGARPARAGEFTLRAFVHGKLDLVQAEAVRDRIAALVASGGRGQLVRDGARVVVAGLPNVGKSSVFNALVGADRAIVTAVPGTTRDLVSERLVIDGALVLLIDTAGLRDGVDEVEVEGVRRAREAMERADVVVLVLDRSRAMTEAERRLLVLARARTAIVVGNKADLPAAWEPSQPEPDVLLVSARSGQGVNALGSAIARAVASLGGSAESVLVTNERHRVLLASSLESLDHAVNSMAAAGDQLPEEFVVADLREALASLDEVTGRRTADALLDEIFSTFCIGK